MKNGIITYEIKLECFDESLFFVVNYIGLQELDEAIKKLKKHSEEIGKSLKRLSVDYLSLINSGDNDNVSNLEQMIDKKIDKRNMILRDIDILNKARENFKEILTRKTEVKL